MLHWRQVTQGLRSLFRPEEANRDVADEVRHYLEQAEADLVAGGMPIREARRTVHLKYGGGLALREHVAASVWERSIGALYADIRLATRRLRRSPGFTAVVVLTLGLGIGAVTAIYSAASPVLFKPLDYPHADRILSISIRAEDASAVPMAFGTFRELSDRSPDFDALSVFKPWQPTLTGGEEPELLTGQRVTAGYFDVLGVAPALGRGFDAEADYPGGSNTVILSHGLWRRRFASDPAIIGRVVRLDTQAYEVVAVMPEGFENITASGTQAWGLLQYDPMPADYDSREWGNHLRMIGRMRADVGLDEARTRLDGLASQPIPEFPRPIWAAMGQGVSARPLKDVMMGGARPTMMVLLGSVGLLLIITCVNVTILLLARGSRRRGELAMRAALGAGRRRLVRHLMVENLLLAGLGGVVSIGVARLGLAILMAAGPAALPRIDEIALDGTAVGFALTITLLIGAVVGLAPAFAHTGGQLHQATRDAGRGAIGRHRSARRALVITEVTLATVLLVGSGLLLRSTRHLFSVATGFEASNAVVMRVHTTLGGDASAHRFFEDALSAVRAVPGVQSAAFTNQLPLSGDVDIYGAALDRTEPNEGLASPAYRYVVSPGYFQTMGIRLLEGRALESSDVAGAPAIAVVSQAMATHLFEGRDALGTRFYFGPSDEPFTVVGVVDNVKQESLESDFDDAVYVASVQWLWGERVRWIVVAAERDPLALVPAIRHAVWSVDGDQPIVRVQAVDELVERSQSRRRFAQAVLQAFAFMAVLLSGLGLYGLLSGNVGERMREIGVRRVLGAPPESILTLVVGQGMTLAGIGIAIGLFGAALASVALVPLLFGVSRVDLVTYAAVAVLLTAVSAAACWIPAARAVRADPLQTLRAE